MLTILFTALIIIWPALVAVRVIRWSLAFLLGVVDRDW